ncbi:MAG: biotin--[acetyl-CoA-carboxylase] ligase [Pseudomonadota bacterium]
MSSDLWPEGYERLVYDEIDSTNAEAARLAPDLRRPTWIMARHQTAARGRRGRAWQNPEGNFAATLVMRPGGNAAWAGLRSFLAANALYETLALWVDRDALSLKWPNDVLLNEGKVAGILLESAGSAVATDWLAIGFGVNLAQKPLGIRDASFPPVCLADSLDGEIIPQGTFLTHLANHYATEEDILTRLGFDKIRRTWLGRAARLGEIITAHTGREEVTGRFETVDEGGRLVLMTPDGPRAIPAADVFF